MIVFAHAYASTGAAQQQLNAFQLWAARELRGAASAWRTRSLEGYLVIVVDESEQARALTDFTWKGERHLLPEKVAQNFLRRRREATATGR